VGKGKKHFDKRESIKKKEVDKKMRAAEKGNFND
jgi:tmRNA-binding protein